ncbi:hypothetical protein LTR93_011686 [Exophiala xenobiotica]|nr:hypothetical protein LTR93_011686 [Exophiala xenobiotica]
MPRVTEVPGVALITGAASGIAQSIALAFAQAGCTQLALLDINEDGLAKTKTLVEDTIKADFPHQTAKINTYKCDVSSPQSVEAVYKAVNDKFGRIDYSVHCAAVGFLKATADTSVDDFDKVNSIDYRGLWLCSREAIKIMLRQNLNSEAYAGFKIPDTRAQRGAIVNISSGLALYAQPNGSAYCGAKAGVLGLTRADAIDYAKDRIRVNAVLPGVIATPATTTDPEIRAYMESMPVRQTPFRRFGLPEEIADVTVFLAGVKASYVSGASWTVDGGFTAGYT